MHTAIRKIWDSDRRKDTGSFCESRSPSVRKQKMIFSEYQQ